MSLRLPKAGIPFTLFLLSLVVASHFAGDKKRIQVSTNADNSASEAALTRKDQEGDAVLAKMGITSKSIAKKQGWDVESVDAKNRFLRDVEHRRRPNPKDWKIVERAVAKYGVNYKLEVLGASASVDPTVKRVGIRWSKDEMMSGSNKNEIGIGYFNYVKSGETDWPQWQKKLSDQSPELKDEVAIMSAGLKRQGVIR